MLELVKPPLWERRPSESPEQYAHFLAWLRAKPRPLPRYPQLAARHDWASRACAYDQRLAANRAPKERLLDMSDSMLTLVNIELNKRLKAAQTTSQPTIEVSDLLRICAYLSNASDLLENLLREKAHVDLTALSDEELDLVLQAKRILAK